MIPLRVALLLCLAGCAADPPPPRAVRLDPAWRSAVVVDVRGASRILARPAPAPPAASDRAVPRDLALFDGRAITVPPEPAVLGRLTAATALWLTTAETLIDARGRVLARGVQRSLAVRDDGGQVAYVVGDAAGYSAYVAGPAGEDPRRVSEGLAAVEAPRYWGPHRLVVLGAPPGGVLGVWVLDARPGRPPVPVTNAHLRAGGGAREGFVPPPADPESMRIDGATLTYDDGERVRAVDLPAEAPP